MKQRSIKGRGAKVRSYEDIGTVEDIVELIEACAAYFFVDSDQRKSKDEMTDRVARALAPFMGQKGVKDVNRDLS